MILLKGNFDLMIESTCNLHCKNCSVIDFQGNKYLGKTMNIDDVIKINKKLIKLGVVLQRLTLLGGEPTLNKDIVKIINYLSEFKNITFKELKMITNGLNFKGDIINSFEKLDSLRISIYPYSLDFKWKLSKNPLYEYLKSITKLEVMFIDSFDCDGVEDPNYQYSKKLNWERCWKKNWCRHITVDGLYRCNVLESVGQELCDMSDKNKIVDYIESDIPYDYCEKCPQPALKKSWKSNNSQVDKRNVKRGIELIEDWSNINV